MNLIINRLIRINFLSDIACAILIRRIKKTEAGFKCSSKISKILQYIFTNYQTVNSIQHNIKRRTLGPLSSCNISNITLLYLLYYINDDYLLESSFTNLRLMLLNKFYDNSQSLSQRQRFTIIALAIQAHHNQYVWYRTKREQQQLDELKAILLMTDTIRHQGPSQSQIALILSMYEPFEGCLDFLDEKHIKSIKTFLALFSYKNNSTKLSKINPMANCSVQLLYETNPYPQWLLSPVLPKKKLSLEEFMHNEFPFTYQKYHAHSKPIDIMVAGCGTGKQFFDSTLKLDAAYIFGCDISTASLNYARNRLNHHGVGELIKLEQMDILNLPSLHQGFDLIEAVGVLHHLDKPGEGLKALKDQLKPGGVMLLGLYSKAARKPLESIKKILKQKGYNSSIQSIRNFRYELMKSSNNSSIQYYSDFYTAAGCRDLLFHPLEHNFTLPQITLILKEHHLTFLGFHNLAFEVLEQYRKQFPDDLPAKNLDNWHQYELAYPATFRGLYQFYCQRNYEE